MNKNKTIGVRRNKWRAVVLIILVAVGCIFLLPLAVGVWLPDTVSSEPHTLGRVALPSGDVFRVVQYWNGGDFYNTEMWHTSPQGKMDKQVIDSDDTKQWYASLSVDESNHRVVVAIGGNRLSPVPW